MKLFTVVYLFSYWNSPCQREVAVADGLRISMVLTVHPCQQLLNVSCIFLTGCRSKIANSRSHSMDSLSSCADLPGCIKTESILHLWNIVYAYRFQCMQRQTQYRTTSIVHIICTAPFVNGKKAFYGTYCMSAQICCHGNRCLLLDTQAVL